LPIEVVATTWPLAFTPRTALPRLASVSWPEELKLEVAEPPKYAGPYELNRVVEAWPSVARPLKERVPGIVTLPVLLIEKSEL
jgi:hypothetical protein